MQRILVIFVLIMGVGIVSAFAASQLNDPAGAAPQAQQVREQNLDGSGFIRVHEQGTANVAGTVNVGNLPMDALGNVRVTAQSGARTTVIATEVAVTPNSFQLVSDYVDVTGCRSLLVFTRASWADNNPHEFGGGTRLSLDGSLDQGGRSASGGTTGNDGQMLILATDGVPALPPRVAVVLSYTGNVAGTLHSAWLHCTT